jgi:PAS domain S-box-containing protein
VTKYGTREATIDIPGTKEAIGTIIDHLPDATILIHRDGRMVMVNEQTCELFGYSYDELVGESIDILVPEGLRTVHTTHRARYVEQPVHRPMGEGLELRAQRKGGSLFPVAVSLSTLGEGDEMHVLCSVRDLTASRKLERQLWAAQRMEAVGRLAGGVAHDFNNLLTVIQTYASFLQESLQDMPSLRQDAELILEASERGAALTQQLLAFGQRQVQDLEVMNLNDTIRSVQRMLRRTLGDDIELDVSLDANLFQVRADAGQIEQVILNLVLNARDAMPSGGTIEIETKNVRLETPLARTGTTDLPLGTYAVITVSDTGIGMDAETQARVFEPFFSTKPREEGAGLGLSTAAGIIQQSAGEIELESAPGDGTCVRVYLPAVDAVEDRGAEPPGPPTIMVVEDDAIVRSAVVRVLKANDFEVLEAASGAEALARFEKDDPQLDLLLTDVVMPNMSGRELADHLTETRPETLVLFMSGYTDEILGSGNVLDEGTQLIQKPFSPPDLLARVREMLAL